LLFLKTFSCFNGVENEKKKYVFLKEIHNYITLSLSDSKIKKRVIDLQNVSENFSAEILNDG